MITLVRSALPHPVRRLGIDLLLSVSVLASAATHAAPDAAPDADNPAPPAAAERALLESVPALPADLAPLMDAIAPFDTWRQPVRLDLARARELRVGDGIVLALPGALGTLQARVDRVDEHIPGVSSIVATGTDATGAQALLVVSLGPTRQYGMLRMESTHLAVQLVHGNGYLLRADARAPATEAQASSDET